MNNGADDKFNDSELRNMFELDNNDYKLEDLTVIDIIHAKPTSKEKSFNKLKA